MSDLREAYLRSIGRPPEPEEDVSIEQEEKTPVDLRAAFKRSLEESYVGSKNNPEQTTELTTFDRIVGQPLERAGQRLSEIGGRIQGSFQPFDPTKTVGQQRGTDIPSVLLQTLGTPIALGFDSLSSAITVGAEELFALLPEEAQEGAFEFLRSTLQTEAGQVAMAALAEGSEAWEEYSRLYPNDAANIESFFTIKFGLPRTLSQAALYRELEPVKINKSRLGRTTTEPLAGRDKDLYNIAFGRDKKTAEQTELTTDPRGVARRQEQLATDVQLETIDELKKAGLTGSQTLQQNLNKILKHTQKLENALINLAKGSRSSSNPAELREKIGEEFRRLQERNPSLFETKEAKDKYSKALDDIFGILDEQGYSAEGILRARKIFDDMAERKGLDLGSAVLTPELQSAKVVREATNKLLFDMLPGGKAKELLRSQSLVLSVKDNVRSKAAKEAETAIGRYISQFSLDELLGKSYLGVMINAVGALGAGIIASPFKFLELLAKSAPGANMRAKVSYALRDVYREIEKGFKELKDPKKAAELLKSKPVVFASFQAAADQLIAEAEEEQNERLVQ